MWLHLDDTFGGFHLVVDLESADAYVTSELATGRRRTSDFDDFEVRSFDVLDDLSAVTRVVDANPRATS